MIGNYDDDEGRVRNKRSYREKGTLHCTVAGIFKVSKDLSKNIKVYINLAENDHTIVGQLKT